MTEQEKFELAQYAGSGILKLDFLDELDDLDPGVRQLIFGQYDEGIVSGNEIKDNPFESVRKLLAVARLTNPNNKDEENKAWHCQRDLVSFFFLTYETEKFFSLLEQQDKEWLMTIARSEGGLWKEAQTVLLVGMNNRFETYDENFIDEDTGEKVTVKRFNHIDGVTFDSTPEEQQEIFDLLVKDDIPGWEEYGEDEKYQTYRLLRNFTDYNTIGLLLLFAEKYNLKEAYGELSELYRYGDEEHGIFINRKKAKEYYDLAGEEVCEDWNDSDDPGEEDPSTYEYTLTGDAGTLNAIRKMIDDLCRDYGTLGNELGLYVPQRLLMKLLVGSDTEYYRGNIFHMAQQTPNQLVITTEADNGYPLLYALHKCFENLEITMKETDCFATDHYIGDIKSDEELINIVAEEYADSGLSKEELLKAGREGIIKARERYDEKMDFSFNAYAVWWVRQAILQATCEKD